MTPDPQKRGQSFQDVETRAQLLKRIGPWLMETAHVRADALVMPQPALEPPDVAPRSGQSEDDDERWETLSSLLSDDAPSEAGGDVSAFLSEAEFSNREDGESMSETFSDIDAGVRGLQPDLRSGSMPGGPSLSGSTLSSWPSGLSTPSDLSSSTISSESTLSPTASDGDSEGGDYLDGALDSYFDPDAVALDEILGLVSGSESLTLDDERRLREMLDSIVDPMNLAAVLLVFHGRPEMMGEEICAAIISRVLVELNQAPLAVADIISNSAPCFGRFANDAIYTLENCAEALEGDSQSIRDAQKLVKAESKLRRANERAAVAPQIPETPAGNRLREIGAEAGALPRGRARDAVVREGIQRAGEGIEAFDPVEEGYLLDLWGQIDNPQDQASALTLSHETPGLVTPGMRDAVVGWAGGLSGAPPFTAASAGLADGLINCMPFFEIFPTDQLEALQASGAELPDTYPRAVRAMAAIDEELERRVERPPVPVPPDETPAGKRLREIGARIGSMKRGPARDAEIRDSIQGFVEGISALDPDDEDRLLGLFWEIDNAGDQASTLRSFETKPDLATPAVSETVFAWALSLAGANPTPFSPGWFSIGNTFSSCFPLQSFTKVQLEDLRSSLDGLPPGITVYPQHVVARNDIQALLDSGGYRASDAGLGTSPDPGQAPPAPPTPPDLGQASPTPQAQAPAEAGTAPDQGPDDPPAPRTSVGQGRRSDVLLSLDEQPKFLADLDEIGAKLGEVEAEVRAQVLDQIALMSASPDTTIYWNAAYAIVVCAGPSVAKLSEIERGRLIGNAIGIGNAGDGWKAVESLASMKQAWGDGEPAFDVVLAGQNCPSWANNIDEVMATVDGEISRQQAQSVPAASKPAATKKGKDKSKGKKGR